MHQIATPYSKVTACVLVMWRLTKGLSMSNVQLIPQENPIPMVPKKNPVWFHRLAFLSGFTLAIPRCADAACIAIHLQRFHAGTSCGGRSPHVAHTHGIPSLLPYRRGCSDSANDVGGKSPCRYFLQGYLPLCMMWAGTRPKAFATAGAAFFARSSLSSRSFVAFSDCPLTPWILRR